MGESIISSLSISMVSSRDGLLAVLITETCAGAGGAGVVVAAAALDAAGGLIGSRDSITIALDGCSRSRHHNQPQRTTTRHIPSTRCSAVYYTIQMPARGPSEPMATTTRVP